MSYRARVAIAALGIVVSACGDDDGMMPSGEAGIRVSPTGGLMTTEAGGQASFTVVLETPPGATVSIGLSSSDPTEGTISVPSLVFTPDNWNAPQTVTVTGVDDPDEDGNADYRIVTAAAVSADATYDGIDAQDVAVENVDDESAGFLVSPVEGLVTTERGGSATFTVQLTSAPTAEVGVALSSSDEGEGFMSPTALRFTADNWNAPQLVTVTGVDDDVADGPIDYTIVTAAAMSSDTDYNGVDPADVSVTNTDDETAGFAVDPVAGLMTTESGGQATFRVALNAEPSADVTIAVSSSDEGEGTVSVASLTFTVMNWNAPQVITITGVDDELDDGAQPYTILLGAAESEDPSYTALDPTDVAVTNVDNDTAGVTVAPRMGLSTNEGGGGDTFTVVLNSEPSAEVSFALTSADTDEATVSPASLTFTTANWAAPQTVTVTGVDDNLIDGSQPFTIAVEAAVSADADYMGLDPDDVTGANVDDDSAGVTVTPTSGLMVDEGGAEDTFTVVLNAEPTDDVIIGIVSRDVSEAEAFPLSLTFTPMNWRSPQTVTVTGQEDDAIDGNQPFTIDVSPAMSADVEYQGVDGPNVTGTNTDNDSAGVTVTPISGLAVSEAPGSTDTFTVVLNSQPMDDVTIGIESQDGTEATVSPASLVFTPANWNGAQTVTVTGVDDSIADGPQPFTVAVLPATSTDADYDGEDGTDVTGTNTDNDSAGFTVTPQMGLTTGESGGMDNFSVVLNSEPTATVTVPVASLRPSEASVSPAQLVFTTVNWASPQQVMVTGVDDSVADGGQPFIIELGAATSADTDYDGAEPPNVTGTNSDNDSPGFTYAPTTPSLSVSEDATSDSFTVVLNSQPTDTVTVDVATMDTDEVMVSPAALVFTDTDWNAPQTVTVTGVNDDVADGSQSFTIDLAQATSMDSAYAMLNPPNVVGTTTDNDSAGITPSVTSGLMPIEGGMAATFTVVLNSEPVQEVVLPVASLSADVTVAPSTLTFDSTNWMGAQTVTVTAVDDAVQDGDSPFTIQIGPATGMDAAYTALSEVLVTGTAQDNDSAGFTVTPLTGLTTTEAGGTDDVVITLDSEPMDDVTIPVALMMDEDEISISTTSVTLTPLTWESGQTVTITGLDDAVADRDQPFTVLLGTSTSTDPAYDGVDLPDAIGLNTDNDTASVTVTAPVPVEAFEGGADGTFTVQLGSEPTGSVTLDVASMVPAQGTVSPATLTFDAMSWDTPQTVTVSAVDDVNAEGDIFFDVTLSVDAAASADEYDTVLISSVAAVARDDDAKGITVTPTSGLSVTEAGSTDTFDVVLDAPPSDDVTIAVSSTKPDEAIADTVALVFTPTNWDTIQTVTVTGVDDAAADGDQSFIIELAPAVSMDADYDTLPASNVTGTTTDDDAAITVSDTSGLITSEDGGFEDVLIALDALPTTDVTISVAATMNGDEISLSSTTFTFTPMNFDTPQTLTITGVDDTDIDGDIAFTVTLTPSGDAVYAALSPIVLSGDNLDDEMLPTGLVINEVDYDQSGVDTEEFIELYNASGAAVSLNGVSVVLVNGSNGMEYSRIDLPNVMLGSGEFYLIANSGVTVPMGVMSSPLAGDSFQNGGPDGVALVETTTSTLLDALSYEGSITTASITGFGSTVSLVEGMATTAVDSGGAESLIRNPDGTDTDDADTDWALTTTPTPGAANVLTM